MWKQDEKIEETWSHSILIVHDKRGTNKTSELVLAATNHAPLNTSKTFPFTSDGGELNAYYFIHILSISSLKPAIELADKKGCVSMAIQIEGLNQLKIEQLIQDICSLTLLTMKVVALYGNKSNIRNAKRILKSMNS